jgi:hypothetical protein
MRAIRCGLAAISLSIAVFTLSTAPASADTRADDVGETLQVRSDSEGDEIRLTGNSATLTVTDDDGFQRTFARSAFSSIDIDAGGGADTVFILVGAATTEVERTTVSGGGDRDTLSGGTGPETFHGNDGDDVIRAESGDDTISGGAGDDKIQPGPGNNPVDGGPGDDEIAYSAAGGTGRIDGGPDFDSLRLFGTNANNTLRVAEAGEGLLVEHAGPANYSFDAVGVDKVEWFADSGEDTLETNIRTTPVDFFVDGGGGLDALHGGPGDDEFRGGFDEDTLRGGGGDDRLFGNRSEDTLDGGDGADQLTGGEDADTFTCDGNDTVLDLEPGELETACFPEPPALEPEPVAPSPPAAPGAPEAPAGPGTPEAPAAPPAGSPAPRPPDARGLARPRVTLTRKGVKVALRNDGAAPLRVSLAATERRGRKLHRYRRVSKTILAGGRVTVTLEAPRALRRQLLRRARGKRRPTVTVTNLATGARVTARAAGPARAADVGWDASVDRMLDG